MTVSQALSEPDGRQRSLASVRRQREKNRMQEQAPQVKQVRDVVIPDTLPFRNWQTEWQNGLPML